MAPIIVKLTVMSCDNRRPLHPLPRSVTTDIGASCCKSISGVDAKDEQSVATGDKTRLFVRKNVDNTTT